MCDIFDAEYYEKTREEFEKRPGKKLILKNMVKVMLIKKQIQRSLVGV